jgi:hypothetical protein
MTNNQAMIDHIATEVMGWHEGRAPYFDWCDDTRMTCKREMYNPFENHQQAFDALEKIDGHIVIARNNSAFAAKKYPIPGIEEKSNIWFVRITLDLVTSEEIEEWYSEDLLTAICHAVCEASGYEE